MAKILRSLNIGWMGSRVEEMADGKTLIKDITLLSAGSWTDSAVGTPLYYPEETLAKYANHWTYNGLWSRHAAGEHRPITERLGIVNNPRYDASKKAVVGDLLFYNVTQASKDAAALARASVMGQIDPLAVSVEHYWEEETNGENTFATQLDFVGLAIVEDGACADAKLLSKETEVAKAEVPTDKIKEDKHMDEKELAAFRDSVFKEADTKYKADAEKANATIAELNKRVEELSSKVKELENVPVQPVPVLSSDKTEVEWTETVKISSDGTIRGA